ncbi:alkyl sulfatase dimerization domain-containing protein [Caulobacter sp. CCUG 60055]|nr:alkyl sulfatase dimerization domain-containing protein [Caulobacter sp. CCUG 60055]
MGVGGMVCGAALAAAVLWAGAATAGEAPSAATVRRQAEVARELPFEDRRDFDFASRGYLGTLKDPVIRRADGGAAWDLSAYDFLKGEAPPTVNPSLWRQAQLLAMSGLFEVAPGVYQVRGFDVANITFIRGAAGWIVVDPLTSLETARAAYALVSDKLGPRPVTAVIYTHSHVDHFGGVRGVVDQKDVDAGKVAVVSPQGFLKEVVSENVIAGPAMTRRAQYQFGHLLAPSPTGQLGSGIGLGISKGTITLIPPTVSIERTGQELTLDGVRFRFQVTPGTEAPAEMNFYLPDLHVLDMAENANVTMHNVLTPRGALVRDSKAWADYLTESIRLFGDKSDVMMTSHGWPRFGGAAIADFLADHRDAYKYLHDQSVRMMNQGMTGDEIAARIALPKTLAREWFDRGYYGSLSFNSRAVYQRYMGWYDANPAHLEPRPPADVGKRYVEAMGGAAKVLAMAQAAYDRADYAWAAVLLDHLVMAGGDPAAKALLARTYDQLGYQSENSLARNMYLTGAAELRDGVRRGPAGQVSADLVRNLPSEMIFDLLSVRLDAGRAGDARLSLGFVFPERGERFVVQVRNGVLVPQAATGSERTDAVLTAPRAVLLDALFNHVPLQAKIASGDVKLEGDASAFARLAGWFDAAPADFPIVTR